MKRDNEPGVGGLRRWKVLWRMAVLLLWLGVGFLCLEVAEAFRLARASRVAAAMSEERAHAIPGMRLMTEAVPVITPPAAAGGAAQAVRGQPRRPTGRVASLADWLPDADVWERYRYALEHFEEEERQARASLTGEYFAEFDSRGRFVEAFGDARVERQLLDAGYGRLASLGQEQVARELSLGLSAEARFSSPPGYRFRVELHRDARGHSLVHAANELLDAPWEQVAEAAGQTPNNHVIVGSLAYFPNYRKGSIQTDSLGFKAAPVTIPKPDDVFRIVCFGGSTTEESDVGFDRVTELLERRYAAECGTRRIEVVNAGLSGADSYSMRLRVNDYLAYEPDILLYYEGINDIVSHVDAWCAMAGLKGRLLGVSRVLNRLFNRHRLPSDAVIQNFMRSTTLRNLQAIRWAAEAHGTQLVVCSFALPKTERLSSDEAAYMEFNTKTTWLRNHLDFHTLTDLIALHNGIVKEWAERHSLLHIPVQEEFDVGMDFFRDVCHMDLPGTKLRTEIVYQYLAPVVPPCVPAAEGGA